LPRAVCPATVARLRGQLFTLAATAARWPAIQARSPSPARPGR